MYGSEITGGSLALTGAAMTTGNIILGVVGIAFALAGVVLLFRKDSKKVKP